MDSSDEDRHLVLQAISPYLENIRRAGPENIMATCPFHTMVDYVSVTLSFNLVRGVFFCFSCKTKGNLRTFLRDLGQEIGRAHV